MGEWPKDQALATQDHRLGLCDIASGLLTHVWPGPRSIHSCMTWPQVYSLMCDMAPGLFTHVWPGPRSIHSCVTWPQVYSCMCDLVPGLFSHVWHGSRLYTHVWPNPRSIHPCVTWSKVYHPYLVNHLFIILLWYATIFHLLVHQLRSCSCLTASKCCFSLISCFWNDYLEYWNGIDR